MPPPRVAIEDTPNPHARKFTADRVLNPGPTRSYLAAPGPETDALAASIFALGPVTSVLIVRDFVTVNKKPGGRWSKLEPRIVELIERHLATHG